MKKETLAALLNALFSDIKDAKTLALRAATIFLAMLSYFIISNQADIVDFAKNFSRNSVISQVQLEATNTYPKKARERASMLYTQTGADGVFVAEYKPKFINNYEDVIAWETALKVNPTNMLNLVIDKSSPSYQTQVLGHPTSFMFKNDTHATWGETGFITSGKEYTTLGISYLYTCPIFDLANSYSGYIGIGYVNKPYSSPEEKTLLNDYLQRVCEPQARSLGRLK